MVAAEPAAGEAAEAAEGGRKRRRLDAEGGSGSRSEEEDEEAGSGSEDDDEEEDDSSSGEEEEEEEHQQRQIVALSKPQPQQQQQSRTFAGGHWKLTEKHYFNQRGAKLSSADFQGAAGLLAVGFSNGIFELLQLPDLATVHTLSIGRCVWGVYGVVVAKGGGGG